MKYLELTPDEIIPINDYPIRMPDVMQDYVKRYKAGEDIPKVPVIHKDLVKPYLTEELQGIFELFFKDHPNAKYFFLDGTHRTTAATIAGKEISVIVLENDQDIKDALEMVKQGILRDNGIEETDFAGNCNVLSDLFKKNPFFETVSQKTKRLKADGYI